jgi:hypothetical protein
VDFLIVFDKKDNGFRGEDVAGLGGVADFAAEIALFQRRNVEMFEDLVGVR